MIQRLGYFKSKENHNERPGSHFLVILKLRIKAERYLISISNSEVFYEENQKMDLKNSSCYAVLHQKNE